MNILNESDRSTMNCHDEVEGPNLRMTLTLARLTEELSEVKLSVLPCGSDSRGRGSAYLSSPTGGMAKGIPRNSLTSWPSGEATNRPWIVPTFVLTTGILRLSETMRSNRAL